MICVKCKAPVTTRVIICNACKRAYMAEYRKDPINREAINRRNREHYRARVSRAAKGS